MVSGPGQSSELVNDAVVNGKYRIVKHPNRWAVGIAYPAQDVENREAVVLVLPELSPDQGPGFVQRARVEVERTRKLQGGHVITLRDCGLLAEGLPYFVIRRVQGNSLLRAIAHSGPFATELALHLMDRMLSHVADAHALGVILGDIRPANVILTERLGQTILPLPEPEIVDMAFARGLFDGMMSLPEAPAAYRSPEMRAGLPISVTDDIYALGAVLYFILTGKAPRAQTLDETRQPPAPSLARPDLGLSAYLDKVVQTALSPKRADRYSSVRPFHEAIMGLRELFTLSDAARGVLQMAAAEPGPGAEAFESDPTQEFGRELVDVLATRLKVTPIQGRRFDQTIPFDPRELDDAIRKHSLTPHPRAKDTLIGAPLPPAIDDSPTPPNFVEAVEAGPVDSVPGDDVMTSAPGTGPLEHGEQLPLPAAGMEPSAPPNAPRAEDRTTPFQPDMTPEDERPPNVHRTTAPPMALAAHLSSDTSPVLARSNMVGLRPQPSGASQGAALSNRNSQAMVVASLRATAEAAHVLQAARDHENPFMLAPLRLDAEVRSVNAPPQEISERAPRLRNEAAFWRGVVFTLALFALALGLGYLLFHTADAPPPPPPARPSSDYLPSVSVTQPPRAALRDPEPVLEVPGPHSAVSKSESGRPLAGEVGSPASALTPPAAVAPTSAAAPASAAPPADEVEEPEDDVPPLGKNAGASVNLVLIIKPEGARMHRVKTGELLCRSSPCRLVRPKMPRGYLKVRLSAPGLPDRLDHIPLAKDGVYRYDMRTGGPGEAEDKPGGAAPAAAPTDAPADKVRESPELVVPPNAAPSPPPPSAASSSAPPPAQSPSEDPPPSILQPF